MKAGHSRDVINRHLFGWVVGLSVVSGVFRIIVVIANFKLH